MALELDDRYIGAAALTGYVRAALAEEEQNQFDLQRFLPDTEVDDIEYRAMTGGGGLARVAKFRSFDTESPIGARRGFSDLSGQLPPISEKIRLGEYDRLQWRNAPEAIRDAILDDGVEQARKIHARAEVGRGQLLMSGKVTIEENGLVLEADFGRKAAHSPTAGTLWSQEGSKPVDDLLAWRDVYRGTNGIRPGTMLVSSAIEAVLLRHPQIRAMTLPAGATTQIVTVAALQELFRALSLPAYEVYEAQVADDNDEAFDILDPNHVLFLPPAGRKIGETVWGVTAEAMDANYKIDRTERPGIVVGSYSENDPVSQWTKASAIMLPIAPNVNLTLGAKVL